jgi:hypothetical protein
MPSGAQSRAKQKEQARARKALGQQQAAAQTPGVATKTKNGVQTDLYTTMNNGNTKEATGRRKDSAVTDGSVAAVAMATEKLRLAPIEAEKESTAKSDAAMANGSVREGMLSELRTRPPCRGLHL